MRSGRYTLGAAAGSTPTNSAGTTPTTVNGVLSIRMCRPTALTAAPKRRWL